MKVDRMLDRFAFVMVAVVMVTLGYLAWVVGQVGPHWAHLYWLGLGAWGIYVVHHVEQHIGAAREKEFKELVDDWVKRGSPNEPLELDR